MVECENADCRLPIKHKGRICLLNLCFIYFDLEIGTYLPCGFAGISTIVRLYLPTFVSITHSALPPTTPTNRQLTVFGI